MFKKLSRWATFFLFHSLVSMEMFEGHPVLDVTLEKEEHQVNKISLVDFPAMEENWLSFAKTEDETMNFKEMPEQKLAGPFIIPGKKIPRLTKDGEKFYVRFSGEVVKELAARFNKRLKGDQWNTQHNQNKDVEDVYVLENWIIDDSKFDKSKIYGHNLPVGTWYGIVKVDNTPLWQSDIETGKLRGFSIEMVSGLQFAVEGFMNDQKFEKHVSSVLEQCKMDNVVEKGWKYVASFDLDDDEEELTELQALERIVEMDKSQMDFSNVSEGIKRMNFTIDANPNDPSILDVSREDFGRWRVRYLYEGPRDDNNRNFCATLLDRQGLNSVYRREDINIMSFTAANPEFGRYSIFRYKGSYGCRHKWKRVIFFDDSETGTTRRVGNVPAVTGRINDRDARTINANLQTQNKMAEFSKIEELPVEGRVVDAVVDNSPGEYVIDGKKYVVTKVGEENKITEIIDETDETPDEANGDMAKFMADTTAALAELTSKVEALDKKVNQTNDDEEGDDPNKFSLTQDEKEKLISLDGKMEKLTALLSLLPSEDDDTDDKDKPADVRTALSALKDELSK